MRKTSILFLRRDGELLLAMKKRGFGEGKWNGPGGKQEPGESIIETAIREAQEEIGITPLQPQLVGRLKFYLKDQPQFDFHCHIYVATEWEGEPSESEEMAPRWFRETDIPYETMWADDRLWMPLLLDGQLFEGSATLDGDRLTEHDIKTVIEFGEDA